jgi:hypothetical protein
MFNELFDSYSVAYSKDDAAVQRSGAKKPTFTLENDDVKCFVQTPTDEVVALYAQRNEVIVLSLWFKGLAVYDSVAIGDRVVFKSTNYIIAGRVNVREAGKLFRLDLKNEIT